MKIGIVGDLHIAPEPENRIDDYFHIGLQKIEEIAVNCDYIIFTGDIFSKPKVDDIYKNALITHLNWCKKNYNCNFATIIGNHDVAHEEEDNIKYSSLGTLEAAGVLEIIKPDMNYSYILQDNNFFYRFKTIPVKFKNAQIYLQNFNFDVNPNFINILLVHHLYETGTECFNYQDFQYKNINMIFFGHDHKPLDKGRIIYDDLTVYRSGSIMRNIANDYNLERQLYYYVLENGNVSCQSVTTIDAKTIFKADAYTRSNYNKKKFTESIDTIIDKYKNNINTENRFSIKNILEELKAPERVLNYIKKQYEKVGDNFI